ncbi:MAG: divergent polysaccharide deacetylase family protein [Acetobacteraceae bacterium]|nr:divergent polysaccharide deacetylase family protein [Acetobacteraceae bacterium]
MAEPDPALLERLRDGSLPRIAEDGRAPWRTYARPFDQADRRPRIGILVAGLGISESATEQVIQRLPGAVTLAFSPYGLRLAEFAAQARADGHEVLVGIPMEPVGFPLNDPGPYALLTSLPWGENNQRLTWILSRFPGYVGATNVLGPTLRGERFSASPESMRPFLDVLRARGLMFVEARPGEAPPQGLPARGVDVLIDERPMRAEIDQRLADLERIARERGAALGLSGSSPLAIERLGAWAAGVEARGFALAPATALAGPQGRQAQR